MPEHPDASADEASIENTQIERETSAAPDAEELRELSVLAATHAVMARERRAKRLDILGESVLRVLRTTTGASVARVQRDLSNLWRTTSINEVLVRAALSDAHAAGLVNKTANLLGENEWFLTDQAIRDLDADARWARKTVAQFTEDALVHLEEDPDWELIGSDRAQRLIARVREALAVGAEGLYDLVPGAKSGTVRAARYNEREALNALATLQPASARRAAERLLLSTLNPDDALGEDFLNLLAAGNVLHGLVTRRDLDVRPELSNTRIVLDTVVLVGLANPASDEARNVREVIELSLAAGVEVVVPDHTLAEWTRLFDAAAHEVGDRKAAGPSPTLSLFVKNPFVKAFMTQQEEDPDLAWEAFSRVWRDPRAMLAKLGVTLRSHGNEREEDRRLADNIRRELRRMNRERGDEGVRRHLRNAEAIDADAESAAMVARWRENLGSDRAFFVSADRMTGAAYRTICQTDKFPLVVTLPAWLLLVAELSTDDPTKTPEVAKIVGNAAIRDSFFGLAACFTYDEVLALSETLSAGTVGISNADVVQFVQGMLGGLEDEADRAARIADIRLRGARLLQGRAARRDQRARRAEELANEKASRAIQQVHDEAEVARNAERLRHEKSEDDLRARLTRANEARQRWRRTAVVIPISILLIAIVTLLWREGNLDDHYRKPIALVAGALAAYSTGEFIRAGAVKAARFAVGFVVLPFVISVLASLAIK